MIYFYLFGTSGYPGVTRFGGPWYPANNAILSGAGNFGDYVNDGSTQLVQLQYSNAGLAIRYTP